jgi:hypothetical protein
MCTPQERFECMQVERERNYAHEHFTVTEQHSGPQKKFHLSLVQVRRIFGKQFGAHFFPPRLPSSDIFSWHTSSNFGMVASNAAEIRTGKQKC